MNIYVFIIQDSNMKKEFDLILKSVLKKKSQEDNLRIGELLSNKLDWCEIAGQIINHRLSGYFYNGLTAEQRKKIPKELNSMLKLVILAQENQLKEKLDEFSKVNDTLEANHINYCGLKGLVFCADFYDLGDRRSNDIDIMVHERDLEKLDKSLRSVGYIQSLMYNGKMEEATKKEKLIQRMNYHDLVPYVKQLDNGVMELDINFRFDSNEHNIDDNIFDYGTQIYNNNGYSVRGLPFYTNLLFLCIHFHREATNTIWTDGRRDVVLYKLVDIINCIRAHENEFDVIEWCKLVEKFELEKKCYYTFAILGQFYDDNIIAKVKDILLPNDLSFMDEIFVEGQNRIIHRTENFIDTAFNWIK